MIISFSGLEGSGKTTQINLLLEKLKKNHIKADYVHIYRKSFFLRLGQFIKSFAPAKIDPLVEEQFKSRNPKGFFINFTRLIRQFFFILDIAYFYMTTYFQHKASQKKFIVCDRYFYDTLVQMLFMGMCSDYFLKKIVRWIPRCDESFLFLNSVEMILTRKTQVYDTEYYHIKDGIWRNLVDHIGVTVIENKGLEESMQIIHSSIRKLSKLE